MMRNDTLIGDVDVTGIEKLCRECSRREVTHDASSNLRNISQTLLGLPTQGKGDEVAGAVTPRDST